MDPEFGPEQVGEGFVFGSVGPRFASGRAGVVLEGADRFVFLCGSCVMAGTVGVALKRTSTEAHGGSFAIFAQVRTEVAAPAGSRRGRPLPAAPTRFEFGAARDVVPVRRQQVFDRHRFRFGWSICFSPRRARGRGGRLPRSLRRGSFRRRSSSRRRFPAGRLRGISRPEGLRISADVSASSRSGSGSPK